MFSNKTLNSDGAGQPAQILSNQDLTAEELDLLLENYAAEVTRLRDENRRLKEQLAVENRLKGNLSIFLDQFLTLQKISKLITRHLSYPKIASALLQLCRRIVPDARGDLFLFQNNQWQATLASSDFPYLEMVQKMHDEGITEWIWENDNIIVISPEEISLFNNSKAIEQGCFIFAPLKSTQVPLGILLLHTNSPESEFSLEKLELLDLLAKQASIALQYTSLYKELERAHLELKNSQENLIQAIRLATVGELSGGIAHEINNPLQIILGKIQIALMNDPENETLRTVETQAMRIAAIVRGLLTLARQRDVQSKQHVSIEQVLHQTLDLVRGQIEKRGVQVDLQVEKGLPGVFLNVVQLQQVLLHFFLSAKRQLIEGGTLTVRARAEKEKSVVIEIQDSGVPIDAKILKLALQPFDGRSSQSCSENHLGLTMSVQMIRDMGGEVELSSSSPRGNLVVIKLPINNHKPKETVDGVAKVVG